MSEDGGFEGTREEMERAIRRLNALEYVILAAAVVVALAGGALVALVFSSGTSIPFRLAWGICSILLLTVPGVLVLGRDRSRARSGRRRSQDSNQEGE